MGQLVKLSKALSLRMADVISTGEEAFTIVRSDQRQRKNLTCPYMTQG